MIALADLWVFEKDADGYRWRPSIGRPATTEDVNALIPNADARSALTRWCEAHFSTYPLFPGAELCTYALLWSDDPLLTACRSVLAEVKVIA